MRRIADFLRTETGHVTIILLVVLVGQVGKNGRKPTVTRPPLPRRLSRLPGWRSNGGRPRPRLDWPGGNPRDRPAMILGAGRHDDFPAGL